MRKLNRYFSSYWIRSAFYTFLQRFSVILFGLINFILLVRHLSKAQMGTWALFLIVTTTFELSKSALLKSAHIRFVSSTNEVNEKAAIASSSLMINAAVNFLFILLVILFGSSLSKWLNAQELSVMLIWFIPGFLAMIFFSHFEAVQQSHFDFKGVFAGYLIRQVSFFIFLLIHFIFHLPLSIKQLAIYQAISILLGTVILYWLSKPYLSHQFNPSSNWVKKIVKYGGVIFGSGLISNFLSNIDQVLTSNFLSPVSVAYYNTATRISGFIDTPSYAATEILFPKMSKASITEGMDKIKYLYERMVGILLSLITPVAIVIILFPKILIYLIAGPSYYSSAPILQLYMLASIIGTFQNQAANTLNSIGKPGLCLILNTLSLCIKLIATYFCLLQFGFYGAAIATAITGILNFFIWYHFMKKIAGIRLSGIFKYISDLYRTGFTYISDFFPIFKSQPSEK